MELPKTDKKLEYKDSGICSFCFLTLQALQPGGTEIRHKQTLAPYGQCPQAIAAQKAKKT